MDAHTFLVKLILNSIYYLLWKNSEMYGISQDRIEGHGVLIYN